MDKDYHQECMICGEEDIGSNKVYVPRHSNKSRENTSHGGPFKNFNTENQCKDWESNTEPKYSSERSSLVLKEAICMSNDLSNKSMESTSTGTESRETDPEKFVTNLEENCDDTKHRQDCEEEEKNFNSEKIFLGDGGSGEPQNVFEERDGALGAAITEDGTDVSKENKDASGRDAILFFLVLLYSGFVAILRLVIPILCDIMLEIFRSLLRKKGKNYVKKRKTMGIMPNSYSHTQCNIHRSAVRSFGLSYVRHKYKKLFRVRKMGKCKLSSCLKFKDNNLRLSLTLNNGKSSEGNLVEQEHFKRATQNCMILSEDSNYISSRSTTSGDNNGNLKDDDGKSPATASGCFKATDEDFSISNDGCNGLNIDFVMQSSSRKSYIGNYDKFRYISTSKVGEMTEKSNVEDIKMRNCECNVGDSLFQGRPNISDFQNDFLPTVGCTGDAIFQEGNNENVGSAEGSDKLGINSKISIADDQKLGQNCKTLTDNSNAIYGDYKIQADRGNTDTFHECLNDPLRNSGLTKDCSSSLDQDCSSEIDFSNGNYCVSKGSISILYDACHKLRRIDSWVVIGDLKSDYEDHGIIKMKKLANLGAIYITIDKANVTRRMLKYQRETGLYPELFDWKNYTDSKKYLTQILHYGSSRQIVVYLGYISTSNTLPVNNQADEESDHSINYGNGEDGDDYQDREDDGYLADYEDNTVSDYQNSGILERDIGNLFVPLVRHEELHHHRVSLEGENEHRNVVADDYQPTYITYLAPYNLDVDDIFNENQNIVTIREEPNNINVAEMSGENENALMDENVSAILNGRFHPDIDNISEGEHQNIEIVVGVDNDLHLVDVEDFENNLIVDENRGVQGIN